MMKLKNEYQPLKLIFIVIIGFTLIYRIYQYQYSTFLFDDIIDNSLSIIGSIILVSALWKGIKQYKKKGNKEPLLAPIIGFSLLAIILVFNYFVNSSFNKPSTLKIYSDGDYNGVSIDFKTDGTYIFDNSSMGCSDYTYGTYQLRDNLILLDKSNLSLGLKTKRLQILPESFIYDNKSRAESYVYQIDKIDSLLKKELRFRVVNDNRKVKK